MAFKCACETAPLLIQDDELIVGHPNGKPRAGGVSPDVSWKWLSDELDTIDTRQQDPFQIDEKTKNVLREEVFPFWEHRSVDEYCTQEYDEAGLLEFAEKAGVTDLSYHQVNGGGDTAPGFNIFLIGQGIGARKREAINRLKSLDMDNPQDIDKIYFYKAEIITCDGVLTYAKRLSDYALELSNKVDKKSSEGKTRANELKDISEQLQNVPNNPPKSFVEALQSLWLVHSLFMLEENQTGISFGRVDQYLYPFYKNDIKNGTLTREKAIELLGCFFIKCSEYTWLSNEATATFFAGYQPFINITLGGTDSQDIDATNDLTYCIMDAIGVTKMYQPTVSCRINNHSSLKYLKKVVDLVKVGLGFPACHFDDTHVKMMLEKGFSLTEANDYCIMGCVEPQKSGYIYQWTSTGYTQWPIAIEFVLNNGYMKSAKSTQGLSFGNIDQYRTYDDFDKAVKEQLSYIIKQSAIGTVISQRAHKEIAPKPLMSLLIKGCMEKGTDVANGGAYLNYGPGLIFSGLATYVDSMVAIKYLVYDKKKYTLDQINEALKHNFRGYDDIRKDCLRAPKYGNDDEYVDTIANDILFWTKKECEKHKTLYSKMTFGTVSISNNVPIGQLLAATPDGRKDFEPLSDGISPSHGADKLGPTSIVKSVSKIGAGSMNIGMVHNFKFLKGILETQSGVHSLVNLLKTASVLGNGQMQFSYTDDKILRDAQVHPEKHRDLVIRVAGYSAYFVELCKDVQDDIIGRTMLTHF
jgi:formate C-acetyltransferase